MKNAFALIRIAFPNGVVVSGEDVKALGAVALVADYTHTPDNITDELSRHNRAGVPLVLVFPKAAGSQPIVLPEVLTPGIVLDALDRAGR